MQMLQPSITINLKPISHTVENFTRTSPTLPLTYTKVLQSSKFCVTIVSFVSPKKQGERHLWGASRLSQLLRGVVLRSIHIYRACSGIVHGSDMSKKVQQRSVNGQARTESVPARTGTDILKQTTGEVSGKAVFLPTATIGAWPLMYHCWTVTVRIDVITPTFDRRMKDNFFDVLDTRRRRTDVATCLIDVKTPLFVIRSIL